MSIKRIVDTSFWNDDKIVELFSPEDKLFMLYLLTNPHTTQLGIYKINKKLMAFELGYSLETINILLDRFETKYKMIVFCSETNEIAIKNYLKYSIIKGGKPVEDCLIKEIKEVKNKELINYIFNNIKQYNNINETVNKIINEYNNDNDYDNDNDNDVSYHDSYHDSLFDYLQENGYVLSPIKYEVIKEWEDSDLTRYAIKKAHLLGKDNIAYIDKILLDYKKNNITTVEQAKLHDEEYERQKEFREKQKYERRLSSAERMNKYMDELIEEEKNGKK